MKITIAYLPEEQQKANNLLRCLRSFLGDSVKKVKENDLHPPHKHIYVTTRNAKKHSGPKGNA
ncbi:MAG: hypothetical protein IJ030_05070 [Oscillospiraceae bacterium]|nr:hypothetical protein [Oscillospiraceae bacterium]